ncbi:hypothetical protein CAL22_16290 [Bordetella genomosp. 12]|uniref:Secretin/TonB short N-terminal domain-containing protein n=1 Tax=Bordetella genomosp. 12 TaxID=463035 RepID=A0A261VBC4_9BORD|nr:hypothetical protein CAL22_16290 [Bordetella genomosp. 12]
MRGKRFGLNLNVLAISLALTFGLSPDISYAQSTDAVHINIPAQSLNSALLQLGQQTDIQIYYLPETVAGLNAPAVSGALTPEQALARLLHGTGITVRWNGKTASLSLPSAQGQEDVYSLRAVRVEAQRVGETEGTGSYTSDAITLGKTAQGLREIPQSVSVLTKQRMEDQNLTDLGQAAGQMTGLTVQDSGHRLTDIYSRGFAIDSVQLDGGAPMSTSSGNYTFISYDMAEFDRVEVLRGAAGLINGTGNPGGAVNLVRKMPTATPQFNFTASAGRWDNYRTEVDASGPLAFEGKLRGRGVVVYEDRKYFTDRRASEKPTFYGVLEADLGPDAVLAVGGRHQRIKEQGTPQGFPRYSNGADLGLSRNTALTAPWAFEDTTSDEVFAKLSWHLAPRWTLRANASYTEENRDVNGGYVSGAVNPVTLKGSRWVGSDQHSWNRQLMLDINLSGAFDLGGRTHEVLIGADMQDIKSKWQSYVVQRATGQQADLFDIGSTPYVSGDLSRGQLFRSYEPNDTRQYGIYGTLRMEVTDNTKVIVGARANKYKFNQVYSTYLDNSWQMTDTWRVASATRYSEPTQVVPFGGVLYDFTPEWTGYASYAEIFNPQAYYRSGPAPGTGLDPMHGSNTEVGVKGDLLDGKLSTSVALYRIVQKDRAVRDSRYPASETLFAGACCYLNAGKVVSEGVELEVSGEIARGVNIYAGYTYNHNQDKTQDAVFSTITPKHSLKLFGTWQLPGQASAWKVGAGVTLNSKQYVSGTAASWNEAAQNWTGGNVPFDYTQGGYAVWNLMTEYRVNRNWTVALNVDNLFDKWYYRTVGSSTLGNYYGEPRNVRLTLRGRF